METEYRKADQSAWPLVLVSLDYPKGLGFMTSEERITTFVPGTHESALCDTFLEQLIRDLMDLQIGFDIECYDCVR